MSDSRDPNMRKPNETTSEHVDRLAQSTMPAEPISELLEGTAMLHEWFEALRAGGFTEYQACTIIGTTVAAQAGRSNGS